jgi:hypothetical protein
MNYFFGINNFEFKSELQIANFQNNGFQLKNIKLFRAYIQNDKWNFNELQKNKINNDFFLVKNNELNNSDIFFLAFDKDIEDLQTNELKDFNSHTATWPAYRANLRIYRDEEGFSSYQSEYPYSMTVKNGSIISPISTIANKDAEKNYIMIKNIFKYPIVKKFDAYLVNIKEKKIEKKYEVKTNFTNLIHLPNDLIKPEIYLFSKDYLGIPIYISLNKKHISCEHTHPPHEYILSNNKFKKITELKNEIAKIVI